MKQDERRTHVADQLFEALVAGHYSFWDHVHPLFLDRDLTRKTLNTFLKYEEDIRAVDEKIFLLVDKAVKETA